jgi:hypothetical protein
VQLGARTTGTLWKGIGPARGAIGDGAVVVPFLARVLGDGGSALGRRALLGRDRCSARDGDGPLARAAVVAVLPLLSADCRSSGLGRRALGDDNGRRGGRQDGRASRRGTWTRISRTLRSRGEARIPRVAAEVDVGGHHLLRSGSLFRVEVLGPFGADVGLGGGGSLAGEVASKYVAVVAVVRVVVVDARLVVLRFARHGGQRWWGENGL